jgi:ribosomal protein S18 acetylase RimI-like enzyme
VIPPPPSAAACEQLCEYLEWDSQFFGFRVARAVPRTLSPGTAAVILRWCSDHSIDCLYFLADSGDRLTTTLLEEHQFRFVDIRITLSRDIDGIYEEAGQTPVYVRPAREVDIPALRAIARASHRDSRFYYDPQFPLALCDALYETWIEKSCEGYADLVLVAELEQRAVGYLSCHLKKGGDGEIGIVAVDEASRGTGAGRKLVLSSLNWFADRGVKRLSVVTQGRNAAAQRLYQRCGFLTDSVRLWSHKWFHR